MPVCPRHAEQALQTLERLGSTLNASADGTHRVSSNKGETAEEEGHVEVQGWMGSGVGVDWIRIHCLHVRT